MSSFLSAALPFSRGGVPPFLLLQEKCKDKFYRYPKDKMRKYQETKRKEKREEKLVNEKLEKEIENEKEIQRRMRLLNIPREEVIQQMKDDEEL